MHAFRPSDNFFIRHATGIAIASLTVLMALVALVFWHQGQDSAHSREMVVHTYEVRGHIRRAFSLFKDVETAQRGFIITGDETLLQPYEDAMREVPSATLADTATDMRRSLPQELALVRYLTRDNPAQQANMDEMEDLAGKFLAHVSTTIEARRTLDPKITGDLLDFHYGSEIMDRIRSLVRVMEMEETHLLSLRSETDALNMKQNERMVFGGMLLFYLCMTLSIWTYQRSRAAAQSQLMRYTVELEKSEEELKMQQEELKASNEEIEASNEELEEKNRVLEDQNVQIQQQSEELGEANKLIEEKARELARASKYKSEFLANMSHELRTPLNSLLILAKLLASNESGNLTDEQMEEARVIHNGGLELLGLINDILDLSKVEAGKLSVNAEDVLLDSIVSHIRQQFAPVAKEKGVAFPVAVADNLPAVLHTDAQRVEQILKNLLSNAFKFTERGSVTLEICRPDEGTELYRASLGKSSAIAFCVTDTGIGIETSKLKDIFEAFQQEDGSIDRHYGGTGLGLTIARKFAHMLGGEIHVRSDKGQGSVFTLVLPVRMEQSAQEHAQPEEPQDNRIGMKTMPRTELAEFIADDRRQFSERDKVLLIIEDDKHFAMTLMKIARERGYKCLCAGDGRTGLLLAAEQPVNGVILDLTLPDMDGLHVLDQLKHNLRTRHIPVHIISGRDAAAGAMPMQKGAIGYLTKPVEKEAIDGVLVKIEDMLQSELKHVLVVEDDQKTQVAIQGLLRKKDIELTIIDRGEDALKHMQDAAFDCVILDLQLPDMTGFEWLKKLEKKAGKKDIPPVIVYTARELTEEENRQLSRMASSIIIKGAKSPERLLDEVTLFLHSVESTLSRDQQEIIRMQHNPDESLQNKTLLLVDDDMRNTFALSKLLKKHGLHIVIADNGQMALDKLKENPAIELVIMDIMMPVMDGYQAIRTIRAKKALRHIPIIALTARAMPEEQEKCMAAGANDYLTKPVDIERLLTLLRVWLFKQQAAA